MTPQLARQARPVAKAALKAALTAMHEAQVRSAEVAEAAEDLYAEAKAEVTEEAMRTAAAEGDQAAGAPPEEASADDEPSSAAA
jgi:hypothetical protein